MCASEDGAIWGVERSWGREIEWEGSSAGSMYIVTGQIPLYICY